MRVALLASVGIRPVPTISKLVICSIPDNAHTQASQSVHTVNVHRATSANTLTAAAAERQRGIDLILDADERIQHHRPRLVQIQSVCLHARLLLGTIGIPSVDVESLGSRRFRRSRLLHG